MEFDCDYRTDYGCKCRSWVNKNLVSKDGPIYCNLHRNAMAAIDKLELEINEVIAKARAK